MSALDALKDAIGSSETDILLQSFEFSTDKQNQMLFFIKPEVFLLPRAQSEAVVNLMRERLSHFGAEIAGGYLMSAASLEQKRIMDRHYGYINQVSRSASTSLSEADSTQARKLCGAPDSAPIHGGHEVLQAHPSLTAKSVDELWATKKSHKIRSGLYVELFDINGIQTVIINGFHPYQLEHFTGEGRMICLLLLNSGLPWRMLRSKMLGDTFPERAVAGSIRGELNRNAADFGFAEVTIANNCTHMSAGAFEAAFELNNFLSGVDVVQFDLSAIRQTEHFRAIGLQDSDLQHALGNPVANISGGRSSSLFDETEECDALSAAVTFKQFFV